MRHFLVCAAMLAIADGAAAQRGMVIDPPVYTWEIVGAPLQPFEVSAVDRGHIALLQMLGRTVAGYEGSNEVGKLFEQAPKLRMVAVAGVRRMFRFPSNADFSKGENREAQGEELYLSLELTQTTRADEARLAYATPTRPMLSFSEADLYLLDRNIQGDEDLLFRSNLAFSVSDEWTLRFIQGPKTRDVVLERGDDRYLVDVRLFRTIIRAGLQRAEQVRDTGMVVGQ